MDRSAQALASPQDEASLVARIVRGDPAAFETLMRRHNRRLYRLARATLKSGKDAEDALQDAYLQAWRGMCGFRGESSLSTWLSRLVLNECFARLRRDSRRQNVIPMIPADAEPELGRVVDESSDRPEQALARLQLRSLLESKLDQLPDDYRVVFVLRSVEEMSVEDAARTLEIPEATVRSRHFRARSLLRESLAQEIDLAERDVFEFGGEHCDRVVAAVMSRL